MPAAVALYFTDANGPRWRVYDVAFGPPHAEPHKHRILELGDPRATSRLFVPPEPEPMLRTHNFRTHGGRRDIAIETLAAQLRAAANTTRRYDPPARQPPGPPLGQ